ncbi:MAG TPA: hypothetical protein VG388_12745 [Solirubrobacteraceae bacterium]|nr:hypothetical protein [Solirubrobacteraceae bacterium]
MLESRRDKAEEPRREGQDISERTAITPGLGHGAPSERRLEAAARAYWRELSDTETSERAVAVSVAALERTARSPGVSESDLVRVAHLTAAETAADTALPPGSRGHFAGKHKDECAATPTRLAALFSGELFPDVREELLSHLETCLACRALELKMRRAERAFATTVSGALTADETLAATPQLVGAADLALPTAARAGPGGEELGRAPWSAGDLRWITRLVEAEEAWDDAGRPTSHDRSGQKGCAATPRRLAAHAMGRLRDDERQELEAHLRHCLPCQATELRMQRAARALSTLAASGIGVDAQSDAAAGAAASTAPEPVDAAQGADISAAVEDSHMAHFSAMAEGYEIAQAPEAPSAMAVPESHEQTELDEEAQGPDPDVADLGEEAQAPEAADLGAETKSPEAADLGAETKSPEAADLGAETRSAQAADPGDGAVGTDALPPPSPPEREPADALALATAALPAAAAGATIPFQPARPAITEFGGGEGGRPARRRPRGRRRLSGRDLLLPGAALAAAVVIAAVLLLGKGSSGTTPKAIPAAPASSSSAARVQPGTAATSRPGRRAKHRTTAPAAHRASPKPAPSRLASTPATRGTGASAPAAATPSAPAAAAPSAPASAPTAPALATPAPAATAPASSSGSGSVSVTPKGGTLPPATAPTQGIGSGG